MIIAALDPSLTSFGLARFQTGVVSPTLGRVRPKAKGHQRLAELLTAVDEYSYAADVVALEGLAFGAKGSAVTDLAGLHWLIRHHLWASGRPYAVVNPRSRMKWVTGKGNASKDECLAAVIRRWPGLDITGNDVADAFTMLAMTCEAYGLPLAVMPADRGAVLQAIEWPRLKGTK